MRTKLRDVLTAIAVAVSIAALILVIVSIQEVKQSQEESARLYAQFQEETTRREERDVQLSGELEELRAGLSRLPELTIERGVRVTGLDWTDRLEAKTGQSLEFMVKISSNGTAHNVWVQAELLGLLIYKGGLKVDGVDFFGDITKGINIGTVTDCQPRIVTWQAQVATASMFPVGTNTLVVPISIWADCLEADLGEVTIVVERKAPASSGGSSTSRPRYDNNKPGGPKDDAD